MAPGYAMTCTVCKFCCTDVNEWNQHLVASEHQKNAKLGFLEWDEDIRKCALVLYASFSVQDRSTSLAVVKRFSEGTTLVTDFVSSGCKPRVVILQFESRDKVHQILATGPSQQVENQLIQLRGLEDFLELEWVEFMTTFLESRVTYRLPNHEIAIPEGLPGPVNSLSNEKVQVEVQAEESNTYSIGSLVSEVNFIMNGLTIRDKEFNTVIETLEEITELLRQQTKLELTVSLYRHNYLKLRNNVNNSYLAFLYYYVDEENGFRTPQKRLLSQLETTNLERGRTNRHLRHVIILGIDETNSLEAGNQVRHEKLPTTNIKLVTGFRGTMLEVQLSRLVSFYCQFDPRVKTLLGMLYHWAGINKITLATENIGLLRAAFVAPDPESLEWQLLFFLYSQEKIIPTPVEIMKRPHNKHACVNARGYGRVDVGFDDTLDFITEWKRSKSLQSTFSEGEFAVSVVQLWQKFMVFCSDEMSNSCLLNTHEGELTLLENLEETERHRKVIGSLDESQEKLLIMEHPMFRKWKFAVNSYNWFKVIIPAMRQTAGKIGNLLQDLNLSSKTTTHNRAGESEKLQKALLVNS